MQKVERAEVITDANSLFAYDRVAYSGSADQSIHLRNLEVVAPMFGVPSVDLSLCRVLELGCADGTNLLPYAAEFPESHFVGVDLAVDSLATARQAARQLDFRNVEFRHANVRDLDATDLGTFDFILCPGIFSWITADERRALLQLCHACLADAGVAVLSYNALPGWNFSGSLRDFIRRCVASIEDPTIQIAEARKAIEFLATYSPANTAHGAYYARTRDRIRLAHDAYIYHDYITDQNQPFYFHEFVELIGHQQLRFVGEADFKRASGFGLEPTGRAAIAQSPADDREQRLDFLLNTGYRSSIVCHAKLDLQPLVQHQFLADLCFALIHPFDGFEFELFDREPLTLPFEQGAVTVIDPFIRAALRELMERWPATTTVDELYAAARRRWTADPASLMMPHQIDAPETLAKAMLAFYGAGLIKPFKTRPHVTRQISDRPQVTPLVRLAARGGIEIVNQWHQNVRDLAADERFLLSRLDGTRDRIQLIQEYEQFCRQYPPNQDSLTGISASIWASQVESILQRFAHRLLLVG